MGSTSYFGRFSSYGDSGTVSGTAETDTHCSTTFSPPTETTLTTYHRVNYTIAKGDRALYLLSCTQTWKPTAKERVLLGVMGGLEAGSGNNSGNSDKVAANAKGKWSECPAFGIGAQYTLTVHNTSGARLEGGSGKPRKLEYLSSAALSVPTPQSLPAYAQAVGPPGEAKVHITSNPSGGEIYIDGKFFGSTPSDITLAAGKHAVKVTSGSKEWSRSIQITAGEISLNAEMPSDTEAGLALKDSGEQTAGSEKDNAVSQMRRIVEAIRQCPETSDSLPYMGAISKHILVILDWNVMASDSSRSPFQGVVHFKVVSKLEETDEAKQSKDLDREYHRSVEAMTGRNFIEYRYEFTLGSAPAELKRAQMFYPGVYTDFRTYEPSPNAEGSISCWDQIALLPDEGQPSKSKNNSQLSDESR
jgi:hypothetical protein